MKSKYSKTKTHTFVPSDAIQECPMCESRRLLRFDGEAFCMYCDWNSIAATFDAIGMAAFSLCPSTPSTKQDEIIARVERAHEALIA